MLQIGHIGTQIDPLTIEGVVSLRLVRRRLSRQAVITYLISHIMIVFPGSLFSREFAGVTGLVFKAILAETVSRAISAGTVMKISSASPLGRADVGEVEAGTCALRDQIYAIQIADAIIVDHRRDGLPGD
jgi:hypothetical protein